MSTDPLFSGLRVISSVHVSQLKSDDGDEGNAQTSMPGIKKHQKTLTLISTVS